MALRTKRAVVTALAVLAIVAMLAACSGGAGGVDSAPTASAGEIETIKVGLPTNANGLAGMLARDEFAAGEGLEIEMVEVNSGAEAIPMLLNGGLDITLGDGIGTLTASSNGVPLSVFGINSEAPEDPDLDSTAVVASDDSFTMTNLDGTTFAVSQLGGAAELASKAAIDEAGGDSSKVSFVELDPAQAVPALKSGQIQAALLTEPFTTVAEQAGLPVLDRPAASGTPGMPATLWVTSLPYASEHADILTRFVAAVQQANDEINSDPDAARAYAKTVLEGDPAALDVIRFPYFAADVADTSGLADYLDLANSYDTFAKQPDLDKLLSVQVDD
ncbi:ABC transporter substrate-binding protein [Agromyces subbeticus]|uniref:ABC transporter substrate-binding protein n=1 Tax=Agromyces subbeticus TaxID=293890 RepID=UPI0003B5BC9B|nr:ABC transporter substrate-binding protein [Agromyces subbeticus]